MMGILVSEGVSGREEVSRLMAEMTCGLMWPATGDGFAESVEGDDG